jgi:hypothetical protein
LDGWVKIEYAYKEVSNPVTDFGNGVDWDIFRHHELPPESTGMPEHWQRILFFLTGNLGV